ncbi:MAG: hypothetical protein ABJA32_07070 [Ginsengibacter sp.]
MSKFLLIISLLAITSFKKPKINYAIEVYVLSDATANIKNGLAIEFEIKDDDLPILPFIRMMTSTNMTHSLIQYSSPGMLQKE